MAGSRHTAAVVGEGKVECHPCVVWFRRRLQSCPHDTRLALPLRCSLHSSMLLALVFCVRVVWFLASSRVESVFTWRAAAVSPSPVPWKQVASYQVALWVGIGLALALAAAVGSLLFMDLGRDPVLYNQFKNEDSKRD
jgi:hypothetical protein